MIMGHTSILCRWLCSDIHTIMWLQRYPVARRTASNTADRCTTDRDLPQPRPAAPLPHATRASTQVTTITARGCAIETMHDHLRLHMPHHPPLHCHCSAWRLPPLPLRCFSLPCPTSLPGRSSSPSQTSHRPSCSRANCSSGAHHPMCCRAMCCRAVVLLCCALPTHTQGASHHQHL